MLPRQQSVAIRSRHACSGTCSKKLLNLKVTSSDVTFFNDNNSALERMTKNVLFVIWFLCSPLAHGQHLSIEMTTGSEQEQKAMAQMLRIFEKHHVKLRPWTFTQKIRIQDSVVPFSHPVLTLNTAYLNNDVKQLATFLHEQFHWYIANHPHRENAISEFQLCFPKLPYNKRRLAGNEYSTYLHLIVCDLEFQSLSSIIGLAAAKEALAQWRHSTWIYEQVLNNPRVREINVKNQLVIP